MDFEHSSPGSNRVNQLCDPHANLHCQPFVITVPCKTATLKIWGVPQINGLEQAGTLPCTLVPVSEIETAVWPAIDISKLPASICSKRQICWDSCDLCFRFISKNIAKIVNGTFSEVAIWMILILVLKWQYQNKLNNSKPLESLESLDLLESMESLDLLDHWNHLTYWKSENYPLRLTDNLKSRDASTLVVESPSEHATIFQGGWEPAKTRILR